MKLAALSGIAVPDRSRTVSRLAQDEACKPAAGQLQILSATTKYRLTLMPRPAMPAKQTAGECQGLLMSRDILLQCKLDLDLYTGQEQRISCFLQWELVLKDLIIQGQGS